MIDRKLIKIVNLIDKNGSTLTDQKESLIHSPIKEYFNDIIDKFGSNKTNLNLLTLLSPSNKSRATNIPRPQNPFMLFRRNFSKGLVQAEISMKVGESSVMSSKVWRKMPLNEKKFWFELSKLAKKIHEFKYPSYKYMPVKFQDKNIKVVYDYDQSNKDIEEKQAKSSISNTINSQKIDDKLKISEDKNENNILDVDYFNYQYNISEIDMLFNASDLAINQDNLLYNFNSHDSCIDPMLLDQSE